ncbi:MAG TPA: thiamine pyrophosphate-binding protein [Stellaceae bacterium]|jgi:acetolactate synthase-1/2/3 large subunit|nr:thiamine pyrophosphate-binding protein [Stellaceae bacterium]
MNELSGAEAFVRMLQLHGVKHIFGLCGDTSLPLYDALFRLDHGITHILARDERSAGYMADGYARVTGRVGVCEGPSGGGATYILPGVVEANDSSIPILAVTTDISVSARGHFTLTELDQTALFRPLAKWNRVIDRAVDIPKTIRNAFSQMTSGRPGAAHIGLPFDVQRAPVPDTELWGNPELGTYPSRRSLPDPAAIETAAELLLAAKNPLFIIGGGVIIAAAERELQVVAEWLGAPVATTVSGHGSISDRHPLAVGVVGSNGGTMPTRALVEMADLIVFIGCRAGSVTTERWRFPTPGKVKVIHIDADAAVIGATYKTDVAVVADARLALGALFGELVRRPRPEGERSLDWRRVKVAHDEKFAAFAALAASNERPIKPERVVADLQAVLPEDAVIVADPGTPCPYLSAYYELARPGRHLWSNRAHGALGYAISAAIGAAIGRPQVKTVAVTGDGSFAMTVGELETLVRLRLPITIVVISNASFGWIKAGQKSGFDGRYFSVDFGRTDHAAVAAAFGVQSWKVEDPAELRAVLKRAVDSGEPTLVDVICQPLQEAHAPVSEWVA